MSQTKHTPGPWAIGDYYPYLDEWYEIMKGRKIVARVMNENFENMNAKKAAANARLIAAAPELLEACKEASSIIKWYTDSNLIQDDLSPVKKALDQINAAIKKATE